MPLANAASGSLVRSVVPRMVAVPSFWVIEAACRAIRAVSLDAPSYVTPMVSEMAIFALAMSSDDNDCVFMPRARSARIRASGGVRIKKKRHRT